MEYMNSGSGGEMIPTPPPKRPTSRALGDAAILLSVLALAAPEPWAMVVGVVALLLSVASRLTEE